MAGSPYRGAYGLALPQFGGSEYLVEAPSEWPQWSLEWSDDPVAKSWSWTASRAVLPVQPNGVAVVDRDMCRTRLHETPRHDAALLHPYLASTALTVGAWHGRLGLHAGVVERNGRAWALLGDRGAGKSSTLMWWLQNAGQVVADDLLLTDGRTVTTGPRFIDLRAGAARQYSSGIDVGVLGTRRRWRVPTGQMAGEVRLAGLIELAWDATTSITAIPVSERLDLLTRHRGLRFPANDELSAMLMLSLPAVRFGRPKDWSGIDDALASLVQFTDAEA